MAVTVEPDAVEGVGAAPTATGRCGTCAHWSHDTDSWRFIIRLAELPGETEDQAEERARQAESKFGVCGAITLSDSFERLDVIPLAMTKDASNYCADLHTQAEFGCTLWEADDAAV